MALDITVENITLESHGSDDVMAAADAAVVHSRNSSIKLVLISAIFYVFIRKFLMLPYFPNPPRRLKIFIKPLDS